MQLENEGADMQRFAYLLALIPLSLCVGCASMCDSSMDAQYHAYGGLYDRVDRVNGRVGSQFDPAETVAPAEVEDFDPAAPLPEVTAPPEGDVSEGAAGELAQALVDALEG